MSNGAEQTYPNLGARLMAAELRARGLTCADADRLLGFAENSGNTSRYLRSAGQGGRVPARQEALVIEERLGVSPSAWDKSIEA